MRLLLKLALCAPMQIAGGSNMGEWRQANTGAQAFPRVEATVPVRVSTTDPETDPSTGKLFFRSAEETTANLSHGGAFVRSWEPLAAGRQVIVDIVLPRGGPLQLMARVVWTQRQMRSGNSIDLSAPGFGIQFIGASSAELARLDRYLDALPRESPASRAATAPPPAPQP